MVQSSCPLQRYQEHNRLLWTLLSFILPSNMATFYNPAGLLQHHMHTMHPVAGSTGFRTEGGTTLEEGWGVQLLYCQAKFSRSWLGGQDSFVRYADQWLASYESHGKRGESLLKYINGIHFYIWVDCVCGRGKGYGIRWEDGSLGCGGEKQSFNLYSCI